MKVGFRLILEGFMKHAEKDPDELLIGTYGRKPRGERAKSPVLAPSLRPLGWVEDRVISTLETRYRIQDLTTDQDIGKNLFYLIYL